MDSIKGLYYFLMDQIRFGSQSIQTTCRLPTPTLDTLDHQSPAISINGPITFVNHATRQSDIRHRLSNSPHRINLAQLPIEIRPEQDHHHPLATSPLITEKTSRRSRPAIYTTDHIGTRTRNQPFGPVIDPSTFSSATPSFERHSFFTAAFHRGLITSPI